MGDVIATPDQVISLLDRLHCKLYHEAAAAGLQGCSQLSASWDPSGGENVVILYSAVNDFVAYAPIQSIQRVKAAQVDVEYKALLLENLADRRETFAEMRSLSNAIHTVLPGLMFRFMSL